MSGEAPYPVPSDEHVRAHVRAMTGSEGEWFIEAVTLRDALNASRAWMAGYESGLRFALNLVASTAMEDSNRGND